MRALTFRPILATAPLVFAFALVSPSLAHSPESKAIHTCRRISASVSSASRVAYLGEPQYLADIHHYATSSSQNATCTIEPGTTNDVGTVLKILGESHTPFAIKGGGHTLNPNFSSTPGVLIAMTRFSHVIYDSGTRTAIVGAGLIWDDVYAALAQYNVSVVGGRVSGIGVAGFTLGGGYSWHTNQFGLALDNVEAFELVQPDGRVVNVTHESDADLFFGLRGGYNNFGIVTRFTLKTFPQDLVWGGPIDYVGSNFSDLSSAVAEFSATITDPKASMMATYNYYNGTLFVRVLTFYDGPSPPAGVFDSLLSIPSVSNGAQTRDFLSHIRACGTDESSSGHRGLYNTVPLAEYTTETLNAIVNEAQNLGPTIAPKYGYLLTYVAEPFLPTILSHSRTPSAYPPNRGHRFSPFNIYFAWDNAEYDTILHDAIKASAQRITQAALAEGQEIKNASRYPNYALYDAPLEAMYGGNLSKLKALKKRTDPKNVMGLAGGFKIE